MRQTVSLIRAGLVLLPWVVWCLSCGEKGSSRLPDPIGKTDSVRFFRYLAAGDSVYAVKGGLHSFSSSLAYYDSARMIADQTGDSLLLAEAIFAQGRVHDAWNKEPQKTIACFRRAAELFRPIPSAYRRYLYAKHLVAHAYDKIRDSTHTVQVLSGLLHELKGKDSSALRQWPFTAEMALIATEVRAYPLADSLLARLTRRSWIRNDPETYDYLDHYYLTKTRLDILGRGRRTSPYLDSLEQVFCRSRNVMDSLYYADNLAQLYAAAGQYQQAYRYAELKQQVSGQLNSNERVAEMQKALVRSETQAERRRTEYAESLRQARYTALWILSGLLAVITVLSVYLYRQTLRYRQQSADLGEANRLLDDKVGQVQLLNKEIRHRVKNNLQMIYSLLQMQERRASEEEVIANMQAARLRVESIAALHNQLMADTGTVDFGQFIRDLIRSVVGCFSVDKKIILHVDAPEIELPEKYHLPLALILNEWITNSVKYAATPDGTLMLNVALKTGDHVLMLTYSDSGEENKRSDRTGLGSEIVNLLCRQLNATLVTTALYHYQLSFSYGNQIAHR